MTSETPCLPGCICELCGESHYGKPRMRHIFKPRHVPNCPNAPKPAEPPACLPGCRPVYSVRIMSGPIQGDQIDHWPNCPNTPKLAAEPPACKCGGNRLPNVAHTQDGCYSMTPQSGIPWNEGDPHYWLPACNHPEAAELCGVCGVDWDKDTQEPCPGPKQKPQSEPPIDFMVCPACYHHITLAPGSSYADILAERDTLKLAIAEESGYLRNAQAENAALKARMEELSESLLWATSSYEERVVILANREKRKEQENTNAR